MTSWRQEKRPIERVERMPLEELPKHAELVQILDVRERSEYDAGHIPGSAFTPWHDIDALPDGLDPARPIAVVCGSGQRAAVAASLVLRAGAREVIHVVEGGVPKWGRLGQPARDRQLGGERRLGRQQLGERLPELGGPLAVERRTPSCARRAGRCRRCGRGRC